MDGSSSGVAAPAAAAPKHVTATHFTARLAPHLPQMRRFSLRLTRNPHDADDLLQDVLLKLLERPERMNQVESLQPWLMRVMYHQFIDHCRRETAQAELVSLDEEMDDVLHSLASGDSALDTPAEDLIDRSQVSQAVHGAIAGLPEQQQLLVRLHDLEGRSLPELSKRLGISINTLKSSLSRARVRLRLTLGPHATADMHSKMRRRSRAADSWTEDQQGNRFEGVALS